MSQPELIISVSGLRGIIGQSLTPKTAVDYVAAYATWLLRRKGQTGRPRVIVARDGRDSGPMLMQTVCSTLMACGVDAMVADVAATPTVGVLVKDMNADGAVQISASHNPPPYNGMKLFGSDGRVIPAVQGQEVLALYQASDFAWQPHDQLGTISQIEDTTSAHLNKVLGTVDVEKIRRQKFRVVLDSNQASGSLLGRKLLEALGCDAVFVGDQPNGQFLHPPEPTENNLASVTRLALENNAQAVFCQDPDADRLAIIDETGTYIGEEYTLAITLNHALSQQQGVVVTNCSSSRMSKDIAANHQSECLLSKVGEANVTDLMIAKNAVYGGEGSGGPIDPRVGYVRDSFVGMAQTLDAMASTGKSISQIVEGLPKYNICKTTVNLPDSTDRQQAVAAAFDRLAEAFSDQTISRQDGLRVDWDDAWLLVRPSNTEPIVRAVAEAKTSARAKELCEQAAKIVSG